MRRARDVVDSRALAVLVALYMGAILSANAVAAKLFVVAGVTVTSGALAIPIVYLSTDLINELYGPSTTRAVVWMGLLGSLILVAMTQVALALPTSSMGASQDSAVAVFAATPRIVIASMLAYLLSALLDVRIFHWLRMLTRERYFWLRKNGSTVVSQAVDTGLFVAIAFAGALPVRVLIVMAVGQYLVKIIAAPIGTPLTYLVLAVARRGR